MFKRIFALMVCLVILSNATAVYAVDNAWRGYVGRYGIDYSDGVTEGPYYGMEISDISGGIVTFGVGYVGRNASPLYETEEIKARLSGNTASFNWTDTWENSGTGVLKLINGSVTLNMKVTQEAPVNRATLATDGDRVLPKTESYYRDSDIKVILDGRTLSFGQPPMIIDGSVMVPMRAIFEALGYNLSWDAATQTATARNDWDYIIVKRDYYVIECAGAEYTCNTSPRLISGSMLVPVRAIAEIAGCEVGWDAGSDTVSISSK